MSLLNVLQQDIIEFFKEYGIYQNELRKIQELENERKKIIDNILHKFYDYDKTSEMEDYFTSVKDNISVLNSEYKLEKHKFDLLKTTIDEKMVKYKNQFNEPDLQMVYKRKFIQDGPWYNRYTGFYVIRKLRKNNRRYGKIGYRVYGIDEFTTGKNITKYIGQYKDGKKHGIGCQYYTELHETNGTNLIDMNIESNKPWYIGEWVDDKIYGHGELYQIDNKLLYKGNFYVNWNINGIDHMDSLVKKKEMNN